MQYFVSHFIVAQLTLISDILLLMHVPLTLQQINLDTTDNSPTISQ